MMFFYFSDYMRTAEILDGLVLFIVWLMILKTSSLPQKKKKKNQHQIYVATGTRNTTKLCSQEKITKTKIIIYFIFLRFLTTHSLVRLDHQQLKDAKWICKIVSLLILWHSKKVLYLPSNRWLSCCWWWQTKTKKNVKKSSRQKNTPKIIK